MHVNYYRRKKRITHIILILTAAAILALGIFLFFRILRGAPVSVLPGIYERGMVTIGVTGDTPPLGKENPDGTITGFEADLATALGTRLVGKDAVILVPVSNRTRAAKLDGGQVDFCVSMISNIKENQEGYLISDPYYTDPIGLLSRDGVILSGESMSGKKIGVFYQSLAHSQLKSYAKDNGFTPEIILYTSYAEAAEGLKTGEIDAFCAEHSILKQFSVKGASITGAPIGSLSYCVAVRSGENDLYEKLKELFIEMAEDGTLAALYARYDLTAPQQ